MRAIKAIWSRLQQDSIAQGIVVCLVLGSAVAGGLVAAGRAEMREFQALQARADSLTIEYCVKYYNQTDQQFRECVADPVGTAERLGPPAWVDKQ